jgi:hypothetical protein
METSTMARHTLLFCAAALALSAAPARAQLGNLSDPSGFNNTGSGPIGGSFQGAGMRLENEMFARVGDRVVFRNAKLACSVRNAERDYRDALAARPLSPAQEQVYALMGARPGGGGEGTVAAALARGGGDASPFGQAARTLAHALDGLMKDLGGCSDSRTAYTEAGQWQDAIHAFNDYVRTAPDAALSPPSPELMAIHDALQRVVDGALGR